MPHYVRDEGDPLLAAVCESTSLSIPLLVLLEKWCLDVDAVKLIVGV